MGRYLFGATERNNKPWGATQIRSNTWRKLKQEKEEHRTQKGIAWQTKNETKNASIVEKREDHEEESGKKAKPVEEYDPTDFEDLQVLTNIDFTVISIETYHKSIVELFHPISFFIFRCLPR